MGDEGITVARTAPAVSVHSHHPTTLLPKFESPGPTCKHRFGCSKSRLDLIRARKGRESRTKIKLNEGIHSTSTACGRSLLCHDGTSSAGNTLRARGNPEEPEARLCADNSGSFRRSRMAAELKARGNAHFAHQEWDRALELYTQALKVVDEADEDQRSALLSNRSACYIHLNQFGKAFEDGQLCLKLRPEWSKAYARCGEANSRQCNFEYAKIACTF